MRQRKTTTLLSMLVSLAVLSACGVRDGEDAEIAANGNVTQATTGSGTPSGEVAAVTGDGPYDGNYLQGCRSIDRHVLARQQAVITIQIQHNRFIETVYNYVDGSGCSTPAVPAKIEMIYTMRYTGGVTQTAFGAANDITLTAGVFSINDQEVSRADRATLAQSTDIFETIHSIIILNGSELRLGAPSDSSENGTTTYLDGKSEATRFEDPGASPFVRQ